VQLRPATIFVPAIFPRPRPRDMPDSNEHHNRDDPVDRSREGTNGWREPDSESQRRENGDPTCCDDRRTTQDGGIL
jgi:hypothetical protein